MKAGVLKSMVRTLRLTARQCMQCRFVVEYRSGIRCLMAAQSTDKTGAIACGRKWHSWYFMLRYAAIWITEAPFVVGQRMARPRQEFDSSPRRGGRNDRRPQPGLRV